jgi:hypothetical protein
MKNQRLATPAGVRDQGAENSGGRSGFTGERLPLRRIAGPAIILLCAVIAIAPQMTRGPSCGHDFDFHLVSWLDALSNWRHGIVYPQWTPSPNYGAGEPRFVFYPPLTWMLGAALGLVFPWRIVVLLMQFFLLAATGLATRELARQAFHDGIATLAGCAAIFSGYTLFSAYERSALAEMTGGFWVPLMLLLMLGNSRECVVVGESPWPGVTGSAVHSAQPRPTRPPSDPARVSFFRRVLNGSALPLTLVVAGAWLSNAPLGVMLSYLLAGIALVLAVMGRSWAPILRATIAAVLGLGLAAFFLVPAAWEQRWVAIRQAVDDPGLRIENSWLFGRHADPRFELHNVELLRVSFIAVSTVAIALIGLLVSRWRRNLSAPRRWWIPLALIPIVVLFLQLPVSEPLWNVLPKMRFLQFPWRWLVVVEAPMAIFFSAAVWLGSRTGRAVALVACGAAFAAATAIAGVSFFQSCYTEDTVGSTVADFQAGLGFEGTDEYAPPDADNLQVATELPFACLVADPVTRLGTGDPDTNPEWSEDQRTCEAVYSPARISPEHVRLTAQAPHAGYLVLRLRTYPAWRTRLNGAPVSAPPPRPDGLMTVPVAKGQFDLSVDWTTTLDVLIGRALSALAVLLVTGLWLLEYRPFRARLS